MMVFHGRCKGITNLEYDEYDMKVECCSMMACSSLFDNTWFMQFVPPFFLACARFKCLSLTLFLHLALYNSQHCAVFFKRGIKEEDIKTVIYSSQCHLLYDSFREKPTIHLLKVLKSSAPSNLRIHMQMNLTTHYYIS